MEQFPNVSINPEGRQRIRVPSVVLTKVPLLALQPGARDMDINITTLTTTFVCRLWGGNSSKRVSSWLQTCLAAPESSHTYKDNNNYHTEVDTKQPDNAGEDPPEQLPLC